MSLLALTRNRETKPDDQEIDDALAGNLCRCTGYAPIVEAAKRMCDVEPAYDSIAARETATLEALRALENTEAISINQAGCRFFAPVTADALADLLIQYPHATLLAGSTDIGLWVTKQLRRLDPVIYLGRISELSQVRNDEAGIEIGAVASYSEAMEILAGPYPDMGEVIRRLGSVQIRNAGTIGGNIANGSPIGDSPPLLIAAGATLQLRKGLERRNLPLEDFFIDYGKQDRQPSEFIEKVIVPLPTGDFRFRAYKVSKRFDQDISAVLGAFLLRFDGDKVTKARLAYGGMAATPKRARAAEGCLVGQVWNEANLTTAMAALEQDFEPISDWRASGGYRMRVAKNLLRRCFVETTDPQEETRLVGDRRLAHA